MKIAFFDSGVGGLTIFREAFKNIKAEYIYLADTLNAPYGIKSKEFVKQVVIKNVKKIIEYGADIIVIACNTATSVAINDLRDLFNDKIIIGTEPAVKVAADKHIIDKRILVCATTLTVKEEKLNNLVNRLNIKGKTDLIPLDGLVQFAENLDFNSSNVKEYLNNKFLNIKFDEYSHLILGCTHFPLFKDTLKELIPSGIKIIDSSDGVIKNIRNSMKNNNLKEENDRNVTLMLTKEDEYFIQKFAIITDIDRFLVKII